MSSELDLLRAQLFRYAQDLDELLDQHAKLQQRHQAVLQSQGRALNSNDQFLDLISHSRRALVVTNLDGQIIRANRAARELLQGQGLTSAAAVHLDERMSPADREGMRSLLDRFKADASTEGAVMCRFSLRDVNDKASERLCEFMAVPSRNVGKTYVYWLMRALPTAAAASPLAPEHILPQDSSVHGIMVTDVQSRIIAVNSTFCSISQYSTEELIGQSTRLLASGRHQMEFYQSLWARLIALGCWTGEIMNRRKSGRIYPEWKTLKSVQDLNGRMLAYVAVGRDVSDEDNAIEKLSRLAYFDELTGLPNRRMLEDRLAQASAVAKRDNAPMSVLFIDLDHFKPINDQYGHDTGDLVLQQVGARLQSVMRAGDTVARVGGDEFVVLMPATGSAHEILAVGDRILIALHAPLLIGDHAHHVGASIGCARFPDEGADAVALIQNADAAMYRSKQSGGGRVCFFEDLAHGRAVSSLGQDLWNAMGRGQMRLVYQPQVSADPEHALRGCEALLRWTHPVHGVIDPATFIPLAEDSGAILHLGEWVLTRACTQMRLWRDQGLADCMLSVNLSHRQIQAPEFAEQVCAILQSTGIEPWRLELEIAVSACMRLEQKHLKGLAALRALGVRIAIDDFGTSASTLRHLLQVPADTLKIDRLFVRDIETNPASRAMAGSAIGVGLALGMSVVAEGIENPAQAEVLAGQGCHMLQGYLTGAPMEASDMADWMRRRASHDIQPDHPRHPDKGSP